MPGVDRSRWSSPEAPKLAPTSVASVSTEAGSEPALSYAEGRTPTPIDDRSPLARMHSADQQWPTL
jgi:hypothetical protein